MSLIISFSYFNGKILWLRDADDYELIVPAKFD